MFSRMIDSKPGMGLEQSCVNLWSDDALLKCNSQLLINIH